LAAREHKKHKSGQVKMLDIKSVRYKKFKAFLWRALRSFAAMHPAGEVGG
jgi:hypothetical protein